MNMAVAERIYEDLKQSRSYLIEDLFESAVRYARIRADWSLMPVEERADRDKARTLAHTRSIDACNILSRNMADLSEDIAWRDRVGYDRKTIGDFACYLHCILGLRAR